MTDWRDSTRDDYERKGFAARSGYGDKPALLIVDFIVGFTDPKSPLGGDFSSQLGVTAELQTAFRRAGLPIIYTTIEYAEDLSDGGVFVKKVPSLGVLRKGSPNCEIDPRIRPLSGEYVISKKYASSFFGTDLNDHLRGRSIDTVVMTGCTTSGCIRASAVDSLQYGFHTIVVSDGCGDRAEGPHQANLFDIDAKYGDVVPASEALRYLRGLDDGDNLESKARADFQGWWKGIGPGDRREAP